MRTSLYNQEISKYKLLSSTAGVGALINTKKGFNVLIHNIDQWEAVKLTDERIKHLEDQCTSNHIIQRSQFFRDRISLDPHWHQLISFVDDLRFLKFLKQEYQYPMLELFVAIPDIALHEKYNSVVDPHREHNGRLSSYEEDEILQVTIPASHFPKTFYNGIGKLRHISYWADNASKFQFGIGEFAPPFDVLSKKTVNAGSENGSLKKRKPKKTEKDDLMKIPLKQVNLVLICEQGHLSEIPWSRYISFRRHSNVFQRGPTDLFETEECCDEPDLWWSESQQRSEGFGSIHIECKNCKEKHPDSYKYKLEGITNLKVVCKGHRPWTSPVDKKTITIKSRRDALEKEVPESPCLVGEMQVTLATANNVYYANNTSSLYIPYELVQAQSITLTINDMVKELTGKFKTLNENKVSNGESELSLSDYASSYIVPEKLEKMKWETRTLDIASIAENITTIRTKFLDGIEEEQLNAGELMTSYRYEEYSVFHNTTSHASKELEFSAVPIPKILQSHFDVIRKVDSLKITSVQLNFSRVESPSFPDPLDSENNISQYIHVKGKNQIRCLPAIQSLGEGIFFSIDQYAIANWISEFKNKLFQSGRAHIFEKDDHYNKERLKTSNIKERYFLVHTMSHLLMKELEFSCGYPVASLKERLYVSEKMAGFLIFTSEGSEGSMGGLVSQTEGRKLEELIVTALRRAEICSTDPLCWEGTGSGHSSLNLAACFSCSIVSETACEERNLMLDRRILLDPEFGFFKEYLISK